MRILVRFKDDTITYSDCCEISLIDSVLSIYEPLPGSDEVSRSTKIYLSEVSYIQIIEDFP